MNLTTHYETLATKIIEQQNFEMDFIKSENHIRINGMPPLTIVMRGDDKYAMQYVNSIKKLFKELGIKTNLVQFDEEESFNYIIEEINKIKNPFIYVRGSEVKQELNFLSLFIDHKYDIDALSFLNVDGRDNAFTPTVVEATLDIIKNYYNKDNYNGMNFIVVNRSEYVGKPLARILTDLGATVTICNSTTSNESLKALIDNANCVIWGTGVRNIGYNYNYNSQLVVDLSQRDMIDKGEQAKMSCDCVKVYGKLTSAMLFKNYIKCCRRMLMN